MAQPNEVKYGLTQRPAPTADDRGRSGSGDLRNGQVEQGSPTLPGENDYNFSEVKYGKPEPRDIQRRGNIRAELPAETATESQPVAEYRAGSGNPDYPTDGKVSNEAEENGDSGTLHSGSNLRPNLADEQPRESGDDSGLAEVAVRDTETLTETKPVSTNKIESVSTNERPVFRVITGGDVSTNKPPDEPLEIPTQKELIASDLKSWKRLKGKPPIPDLHVVNPSGKRKIGRLFRVGYEILRRVPCRDCQKQRRLTAGYISATQLIELEFESYETKAGIVRNILRRTASQIDGRLHDIRCAGCESGRQGYLETATKA